MDFLYKARKDFTTGPRKLHADGSIELRGKRWGLFMVNVAIIGITIQQLLDPVVGWDNSTLWVLYLAASGTALLWLFVLLIWIPTRVVTIDAEKKRICIEHKGLMPPSEMTIIEGADIEKVWLDVAGTNTPLRRPKLFLRTRTATQDLYLVSVGRYYANHELSEEIERLMRVIDAANSQSDVSSTSSAQPSREMSRPIGARTP